jgi:hypothetical protein
MRPSCGGRRIVLVARPDEAERLALLRPAERQSGVGDKLLRREAAGLAALEDGAGPRVRQPGRFWWSFRGDARMARSQELRA